MNYIITQGLRIRVRTRYIKFNNSNYFDITEDELSNCLYIDIPKGFNSKYIVDERIQVLNPTELNPTDYIKIDNPVIDINGLKVTKLTIGDYQFSQFIVKGIDNFIMRFDEHSCEILIPYKNDYDINSYIKLIKTNPYLEVLGYSDLKLTNINLLNLSKSTVIRSTNDFVYRSKQSYTKYILDQITVQESFITNIESKLKDYGLQLLSLPLDTNSNTENRVTYRFIDLGRQTNHKSDDYIGKYLIYHTDRIEFKISTPSMELFSDFKNKYQNLMFLSNFTEFYTLDIFNKPWLSNIFWGPIDTSFNQDYSQDEQGNIGFEASFSAELNYAVVIDEKFNKSQGLVINLLDSFDKGNEDIITI